MLTGLRRTALALAAGTAMLTGCAPDPPSAIVQVEVLGCRPGPQVGSGAFVADGIVLTSAHTLRGARDITVSRGDVSVTAEVVGFDPDLDLAYLRADLHPYIPMTVDRSGIERGTPGRAWVVRDGEVVALDVTVIRPVRINTEDIYVDAPVTRPGFDIAAEIEPGDSGGPVVVGGKVIAVLWARLRDGEPRAYAIDSDLGGARIDRQLASGDLGDVDLTRCT